MSKTSFRLPVAATGICGFQLTTIGGCSLRRSVWLLALGSLLVLAGPGPGHAQSTTTPMPYEECLASKAEMQAQLNVEPQRVVDIVSTGGVTITRLCTDKGSVLIGCSKPSQERVITIRPRQSMVGCLWKSLVKTPT